MTERAGRETADSNKHSPRMEIVLPYLKGCRRLLDIGCNTGWFLDLVEDCQEKWGLDCDETFESEVVSKGHNFVHGYSWNLGFPDESFDAIHFGQTIAHMKRVLGIKSLKEIYRILAPYGIAVFSTVVGPAFSSGMAWANDKASKFVIPLESWFHIIEWEPTDLVPILKELGFDILRMKIVPQENEDSETYNRLRLVQIYVLQKGDKK